MLHQTKSVLKFLVPKFIFQAYYYLLAVAGNFIYGNPSEKLIVIGVTGTNGKSTTVNLIAKILQDNGYKSALTSTVNFKIGERDKLNIYKMTMPGRFFLARFLHHAVEEDCKFAVIEASSEGILQYRNLGIHFDCMVFTNLTPEHIEAHGGFENYKQAKLKYFEQLQNSPHKIINGQKIAKTIVANADDQHNQGFLNFRVDNKVTFGQNEQAQVRGTNFKHDENGISFEVEGQKFNLKLKGVFDFYNALAAIATAKNYNVDLVNSYQALERIENIPGRVELINEGQNFKIVVDYAPEPESLKQLYATVKSWPAFVLPRQTSAGTSHNKIIHVLGSTGGGRDIARRKILGKLAGENADVVIVTNEDPYDDDPQQIIHDVADGAVEAGKIIKENLFREPDRRLAIAKALSKAEKNDLVIVTGKGAEQKMAVSHGRYIDWDDREVVREELKKLMASQQ